MTKYRMTSKKMRFIDAYMAGNSATEAARQAGYSESSARQWGCRLLTTDERVKEEVEKRQAELRERNAITCDSMVQQLDDDRQFAIETGNATAAVRASEIKAKLAGLLVDRAKVETTVTHDIAPALERGLERARAAQAIDITPAAEDRCDAA